MKLKKGSLEAKRFMAKIRAMKSDTKKKTIGATKFVEKKEPKNTKPKRTIQITRKADGTFKKFKQIGGIYDTLKSKVNRATTSTKKNIAYSVIDSAIKSANSNEKLALKKAKETIKNTYLGATKFVEKKEPKNTKPKRTIQITRRSDGTFKKFTAISGVKIPTYYDKDMAREISLFADNDADLYRQSKQPILKNLARKYQKGTFKVELASKLWVYYIENALKKYHKMYGNSRASWSTLMKPADRRLLAMEYAQDTLNDFNNGEFN